MVFDGLELKDYIVRALKDLRFESFTEVQKAVFNKMKLEKNIIISVLLIFCFFLLIKTNNRVGSLGLV